MIIWFIITIFPVLIIIGYLKFKDIIVTSTISKSQENRIRPHSKLETNWQETLGSDFNLDAFLKQVRKRFISLNKAFAKNKIKKIHSFVSDGVYNRILRQFEINKELGRKIYDIKIKIEECRVIGFSRDTHYDTIHLNIIALKEIKDESISKINEVWSFLRKPQIKPDSLFDRDDLCPNCGYVIELSDCVKCPSCSALINSGHYNWVLAEISQANEWRSPTSHLIPGLVRLEKADKTFCIQNLEDRVSSYFWQLQEAMFWGRISEIDTISSLKFQKQFDNIIHPSGNYLKRYAYVDTKVNAVDLTAVAYEEDIANLIFTLKWKGKRIIIDDKGKKTIEESISDKRQCFVLSRKIDAIPKIDCGLSTLSCINCGGPLESSQAGSCDYCGAKLSNPNIDWVLDDIVITADVARMVSKKRQYIKKTEAVHLFNSVVNDKQGLLKGLVGVIASDGEISLKERAMAYNYAKKAGIDSETLEGIINDALNGKLDTPLPSSHEEARGWIKIFVHACLVDGKVDKNEITFLTHFAEHFGFRKSDIQMMINSKRTVLYNEAKKALKIKRRGYYGAIRQT